jgi:hypothetical protein
MDVVLRITLGTITRIAPSLLILLLTDPRRSSEPSQPTTVGLTPSVDLSAIDDLETEPSLPKAMGNRKTCR